MGEIYEARLQGSIHGNQLKLHARTPVSGHEVIWDFFGTADGKIASGDVGLGEYVFCSTMESGSLLLKNPSQ